jgi:hypothetical protein
MHSTPSPLLPINHASLAQIAERRRQIDQIAGKFQSYPWSFFFTGTYRYGADTYKAEQDARRMMKRLEIIGRRKTLFVGGVEMDRSARSAHVHLLIGNLGHLSTEQVLKFWDHGIAHCEVYDPEKNGLRYVVKYLGDSDFLYLQHEGRKFPRSNH